MVEADDDRSTYASSGPGENFPEIYEELPQDVSHEAVRNVVLEEESASPQHPASMENLPEELLSNIFIRLLAKQLAQMRSVSKSWNALLSHSSFIKSHLHHSIHNNDQVLLLFHYKGKYAYESKLFTAKPTQSPDLELADFIKLPPAESKYTRGIRIIGSVNGLICSSNKTNIWNPSLSAVLTLPPYSIPRDDDGRIKIFFRFGYDPKTDDYKVVKLTRPTKYADKWYPQVEIYSMRKGSWELITERFPTHITNMKDCECVCVDGHDGHLHWLGCTAEYRRMVVAFDLGSETFYEIPLPLSTFDEDTRLLRLAGKLCLMSWSRDHAYAVWVMEDESWAKRHVFSQFMGSRTYPLGITSHNQFLIESNYVNIVVYDPSTNEQKVMENQHDNADRIVEYVDSLVWVPSLSLV
ncbi:hypothetical protein LXL04_002262 [Taraxacum kok-saghyz]